ncbi:Uncharacterized protein AC506_4788 [Pseudomonas syringae pv. maculicola str. M6]|nr:Uncharacterized protein AC506_4788 [Pseudomonas syringae pv. maculicola str. M6]
MVSASLNNGSASAMYVLGKSGPVEQEPEKDGKAMIGE